MGKSVVSASDFHCPFVNKKALKQLIGFIEEKRPDIFILNGDIFDMYAFSKYPRNPYLMTPQEEVTKARYILEQLIYDVQKKSPKTKIFITRGNHSERLHKRITEKLPELVGIFNFDSLWIFDNVETILDPRDTLTIDDVIYCHGFLSKPGATVDYFHQSCCIGHLHISYIIYRKIKGKIIYEANSGHMADYTSFAMSYMPSKITKSISSFYYKDDLGPRIILCQNS